MNLQEFIKLALQITIMLACTSLFGQWMRKFNHPRLNVERVEEADLGKVKSN